MRVLVVLCLLCLLGCKELEKKEPASVAYPMKEVMAVHDELMPKMGTIAKLQRKISDTTVIEYKEAAQELKSANEAMMLWMENLAQDFETDELLSRKQLSGEKLKTLSTYAKSVQELKSRMEAAILNAQQLSND